MESKFDDLWDFNDPAATEARFRALLPQAELSDDLSYRAQLLTQIARTQGLQRKFGEAHATLDAAQRLLGDATPLAHVRYLLERGRVFNSSGHPQTAGPLFEQAYELASTSGLDAYAIDALHMIAIVETDPKLQLRFNEDALDLAEKSSDERARRWRASLYNNIGWTYFEQKQYERAREVFEKAVALRKAQNQPRELRFARYCVAKTLRMEGRIDEALEINREVVAQAEQANEPDGYVFEELGECLLALGRADEAKSHFRRAYEQLSNDKWLIENEPARVARLKKLGGAE